MYRYLIICTLTLMLGIACPAMADNKPRVEMETSKGSVIIELDQQAAPITVANFLAYVESGHYENTIFHRVIKSFMIQGGGMTEDLQRKSARPPIRNEAGNGLKNKTGTIAMARTNAPHSATSQFFINTKDNAFLDHRSKTASGFGYCVFGRVVKGMDVVRAIESTPTRSMGGYRDVPVKPIMIKRVKLIKVQPSKKPAKSK